MYYDEQVVNGVLCYRLSPKGDWYPLSVQELTKRVIELTMTLKDHQRVQYPSNIKGDNTND